MSAVRGQTQARRVDVRALARWPLAPAVLVLAACAAWMLSASLFGGKVLSGNDLLFFQSPWSGARPAGLLRPSNPWVFDAVYVFHPDMQLARSLIHGGQLPLWNAYSGSGRPLLASQQSAPLFPLTYLAYVLPFWHSLAWIAALKLVFAGLGAFVFARSLRLNTAPSLLAGVSYAFGSYFVIWLEHPHTNVYLMMGWLLWLTDRTLLTGSVRWASGLALAVGLALIGGHPQSALIVSMVVAGYAIFRLFLAGAEREDEIGGVPGGVRVRRGLLFALACGVGAASAAIMLVPFVEAMLQGTALSRGGDSALPAKSLSTLFFPNFWGRADRTVVPGAPGLVEGMLYPGGVALLLAAGGLALRRSRTQLFFLFAGAVALLVCVNLGPVDNVARHVPGVRNANLTRVIIVLSFAVAMLGAFGLEALMSARRRVGWGIAGIAAAAAAPMVWYARNAHVKWDIGGAAGQFFTSGFLKSVDEIGALRLAVGARWLLLALLLIGAAPLLRRPRVAGVAAAAVVALAAVDLVPLTRGYHPAIPPAWADPPPPPTVTRLQELQGTDHVIGEGGMLGPNLPARYHLNDVRGHDLPAIKRYARLYGALGGQVLGTSGQRTEYAVALSGRRLLDVFGVRWAAAPGLAGNPGTRVVLEQGGVPAILENEEALPRAWVAYGWQPASDIDTATSAVLNSPVEKLERTPVIEGAPSSGGDAATAPTPAKVTLSGDQRVEIEATASKPGWLVFNDTFYPGWKAAIDGRGVDIQPADVAFRAIPIPEGRHTVTFTYRPLSVYIGGAITLLALLAIALGLLWPSLASRRGRAA